VGCPNGPCANDASVGREGSGVNGSGLGMQACLPPGLGKQNQQWVLTDQDAHFGTLLQPKTNSCLAVLSAVVGTIAGGGDASEQGQSLPVVQARPTECGGANAQWSRGSLSAVPTATAMAPSAGSGTYDEAVLLKSALSPELCLAPAAYLQGAIDPFCTESASMWRTSTDTLQTWNRVMLQVESMVGMGVISKPNAWAFPDALELGAGKVVNPFFQPFFA